MVNPVLVFDQVSLRYNGAPLLENINFTISPGEHICLLGKSGVGKTSLLNCITNTKTISKGTIYFNGIASNNKDYKQLKKQFSFLDQVPNLIDTDFVYDAIWREAKNNLKWWQRLFLVEPQSLREQIIQILEEVNLKEYVTCIIKDLSGGQKQRVEVAKLFFANSQVLLVDEPTTGLDLINAHKIMELITQFARQKAMTLIFVTHDVEFALKYSDRIIALKNKALVLDQATNKLTKQKLMQIYHD